MYKIILLIISSLVLCSLKSENKIQAEELATHKEMAQERTTIQKFKHKRNFRIKTVLLLGNSINFSPRWEGGKGMAASVRDSDYVHLLVRDIHQFDPSVVIKYGNIVRFVKKFDTFQLSELDSLKYIAKIENGIETYPLQPGLDSIRNPDMLILGISENFDDRKALQDDFIKYYDNINKINVR